MTQPAAITSGNKKYFFSEWSQQGIRVSHSARRSRWRWRTPRSRRGTSSTSSRSTCGGRTTPSTARPRTATSRRRRTWAGSRCRATSPPTRCSRATSRRASRRGPRPRDVRWRVEPHARERVPGSHRHRPVPVDADERGPARQAARDGRQHRGRAADVLQLRAGGEENAASRIGSASIGAGTPRTAWTRAARSPTTSTTRRSVRAALRGLGLHYSDHAIPA